MPPKKKKSDHDETILGVEEVISKVMENLTLSLTKSFSDNLKNCFDSMSNALDKSLENNFSKLSNAIKSNTSNVKIIDEEHADLVDARGGTNFSVPGCETRVDRGYISIWKDLGGGNLFFSPGGPMHPVYFIKKISSIFLEAGVPADKQVYFATNCMRGSAQDWAEITQFSSFSDFKTCFLGRYWSFDMERETLMKIKFGNYEQGSRADYFLRIVRDARYLTQPLNDDEIINMILNHFSPEIRRGILNAGYRTIDDVENHLRRIDNTYLSSNMPDRDRYDIRQNNRSFQGRDGNRGAGDQRGVTTIFNNGLPGDLLDEKENSLPKKNLVPIVGLSVENLRTKALVDSGSEVTGVSEKFLRQIINNNDKIPRIPACSATLVSAFGNKNTKVREQVFLKVTLGPDIEFEYVFLVIPGLSRDFILGSDWMLDFGIKIDFANFVIQGTFNNDFKECNFAGGVDLGESLVISEIQEEEFSNFYSNSRRILYTKEEISAVASNAEMCMPGEKEKLSALLLSYREIFSNQPGLMKHYKHEIELHDDSPFFIKPYPIPHAYRDEIRRQIQEMVDWGVVEARQTEYVSPLVTVKKKDNSIRVCLDACMVKDHVIPPNPSEMLYEFSPNQCVSTIDLTASYWQVPIAQEHQKYTGFSFEGRTYVFKVLPFGLSTSVGSFIRALGMVLTPDVESFVIPYVDDLLVYSENFDMHLRHLNIIFDKFLKAGITVKLSKCHFVQESVNFLGHIISPRGVEMDPERIKAITDFPAPRNIKELKSFLGVVNYDRRFCDRFSHLTIPLLELLKKDNLWKWTSTQQDAFDSVKNAFLHVSLLKHPDMSKKFYINTDASDYAIGGCLYQMTGNISGNVGEKNIVAFASRTLHGPEVRYTVTEKEALAVVYCLQKWRVFVLGREVVVVSDHKALIFIKSCKLLNCRLTRWILYLQEYDLTVEYCKGSENRLADLLSRHPVGSSMEKIDIPNNIEFEVASLKNSELLKLVKSNFKNLAVAQDSDHFCTSVKQQLASEDSKPRYRDWYLIYKDILLRAGDSKNPGFKICIPREHIIALVKQDHEDNGHFGAEKCYHSLRRHYYFPKMRVTIRKIIAGCELCQKSKITPHLHGEMSSVVPGDINELACLDLMGPLPMSRAGTTYLLAIVDAVSKYVTLFALRRATTRAIIRCLEKVFVKVGKPKVILSDNATQFTSSLWYQFLDKEGVRASHTSVYFPQGNMTERVNREIGRVLRALCYEKHTRWAYVLDMAEGWLNRVVHSGTGYTPEELHFGVSVNAPFTGIINLPVDDTVIQDRGKMVILAHERLKTKAERRKMRFQKGKKLSNFNVGDKVWVRTHPISSAEDKTIKKLFLLFDGPYVVISIKGPNSYEVENNEGTKSVQNIYNLKRYVEPVVGW